MNDDAFRGILLVEVHGAIAASAKEAVDKLGRREPYHHATVAGTQRDKLAALTQAVAAIKGSLLTYPISP
ncbi:MAG TPA: hypothetical protein VIV60_14650 [Polyangiaceae bacterium]